jgi:putative SOS response-associated peptidase YedK
MCGRVHVKRTIAEMVAKFSFADPGSIEGLANQFPLWNGAPRQTYPIIVVDELARDSTMFVSDRWGLIPYWIKEPNGAQQPINAKSETVKTNGMFRAAYKSRRALMPIDGYFEWKDILGTGKNKQPYAIAMKSGEPFALAALWEMWRDPATGDDIRTFTVLTCEPNALMATIHNRMPVILRPADYMTWLTDPDPDHLMKPFPEELMTMWKIGRDVGSPKNNRPDILDPVKDDLFDL